MSLVRAQQGEPKREDHLRWSSLFDFLHNREEPHRRSRSVFAICIRLKNSCELFLLCHFSYCFHEIELHTEKIMLKKGHNYDTIN